MQEKKDISGERHLLDSLMALRDDATALAPSRFMAKLTELSSILSSEEMNTFLQQHPYGCPLSCIARRHYETLVFEAEDTGSQHLLNATEDGPFDFLRMADDFGKRAYYRVSDMFDRINCDGRHRFVLVGCGALPVTLFQVYDHTLIPSIVGLDIRQPVVQRLNGILSKYGISRITALVADGRLFDYADADIIYVANIVAPKRDVLRRIVETAPAHAQIVLRDPYALGKLVTECGADILPDGLTVSSFGSPEPAYLSRNIFLERQS